jgi:hypothetical protein
MPILIKLVLYILAFGQVAVLFASAIGLGCWLLIVCVRAIAWRFTTDPGSSANQESPVVPPPESLRFLSAHSRVEARFNPS